MKSTGGFPRGALESCLKISGFDMRDFDLVAVGGSRAMPVKLLGTMSTFSKADMYRIQEEIRKPYYYDGKNVVVASVHSNSAAW